MKHSYGLQLFSVRDVAETDLLGAIRKVAEIGYEYVEFAGFFGHTAADVRRTMDECIIRRIEHNRTDCTDLRIRSFR